MVAREVLPSAAPGSRWLGVWALAVVWVAMAVLVEAMLRSGVARYWVELVEDGCRCFTICAAAAALYWRAARTPPPLVRVWKAVALGTAIFGLATIYLLITMDLLRLQAPVTTFRHLGYFGGMVCLTWAVIQLPADVFLPSQRLQAFLDGLIISLAIFFIAWGAFLRAMVEANRSPGTAYGWTLAYSMFSVALGALWLFQESRLPRMGLGAAGFLLRIGLAIMLAWWLFYAIGNIQGWYRSYGLAQRADVLFSFRYLCFGMAALWPGPPREMEHQRQTRARQTFLPYLPSLVAMAFGVLLWSRGQVLDLTLVATGALLGMVLTLRHYLTVRDLDGLSLDLERRVQDRTAELLRSQQELMKVQRSRIIAGMAAGFAHDFKNMLCVIRNWTELLREKEDPALGLAAIDKATDQALGLVQEILAAGRVQDLDPRPLDLGEQLRAQIPALEGVLGSRAALVLAVGPEPLPVFLDPDKFGLALVNLAANAAEAMPVRGTLTLRAFRDPVEPFTLLEVEDDGAGIEPGHLDRIFEPFFTTKPVGHGTGLGLSSVHGTILQSGGTMAVRSERGRGTVFTLRLPQTG